MNTLTASLFLAILLSGLLPNYFCRGGSDICAQPVPDAPYNNIVWSEKDATDKPTTSHAIDLVMDMLLGLDEADFDEHNSYCGEVSWKGVVMYGYIYCVMPPVPTSKADCQAVFRSVYNGDEVARLCGRYREGFQVVTQFGCCLRYEKYRFCKPNDVSE